MFSWLQPRCPVGLQDQTWLELRMCWLARRLGVKQLRETQVILPRQPFFPHHWRGDEAETRALFDKFCDWLRVPRESVGLQFVEEEQLPDAVGLYDNTPETLERCKRPQILLRRNLLPFAPQLAATIAHELAHEILLTQKRLVDAENDHEYLTDLTPLFYGLGVILANATIAEATTHDGTLSWWSIRRQGYLTSQQFGYALALFAWYRGETSPSWAKELRPDAAGSLRAGLRYLRKHGGGLFQPDERERVFVESATREIIDELRCKNDPRTLAQLWELTEHPPRDNGVIGAVVELLEHRQAAIAQAAAQVLGNCDPELLSHATPHLIHALGDVREPVQVSVIHTVAALRLDPERSVPILTRCLKDDRDEILKAAATALRAFAPLPPATQEAIALRLFQAVMRSEVEIEEHLARAWIDGTPSPVDDLKNWIDPRESPDDYRQVVAVIKDILCRPL